MSAEYISTNERQVFALLVPSLLLAFGYYLILERTGGQGDLGYVGMMFFFCTPFVVIFSAVVSHLIVPRQCRTRLLAFIVGSIVPFLVLTAVFIYIDSCLPSNYQKLQWLFNQRMRR